MHASASLHRAQPSRFPEVFAAVSLTVSFCPPHITYYLQLVMKCSAKGSVAILQDKAWSRAAYHQSTSQECACKGVCISVRYQACVQQIQVSYGQLVEGDACRAYLSCISWTAAGIPSCMDMSTQEFSDVSACIHAGVAVT